VREFARLASVQEAECYETTADGNRNKFPRLEETIQFAGKCNYRKIGWPLAWASSRRRAC
jgi:hypothetical protein